MNFEIFRTAIINFFEDFFNGKSRCFIDFFRDGGKTTPLKGVIRDFPSRGQGEKIVGGRGLPPDILFPSLTIKIFSKKINENNYQLIILQKKGYEMQKMERNKKLNVIRTMPPLRHSIQEKPFDIRKSEVVQWLIREPDVLNYLWSHIRQLGGYVVYDQKTGTWRGVGL